MFKILILIYLGYFISGGNAKNSQLDLLTKNEASYQSNLFIKASKTSEDFIKSILQPLNKIYEKAIKDINETETKLNEEQNDALNSFDSAIQNVKNRISHMRMDSNIKDCVEKHEIRLDEIRKNTENDLKKCNNYFEHNIEELKKSIDEPLQDVNDRIDEFRLESFTCVEMNPVITTECVYDKINEYNPVIDETGNSFNQAVTDMNENLPKTLIGGFNNCNMAVINKGLWAIRQIRGSLEQCNMIH